VQFVFSGGLLFMASWGSYYWRFSFRTSRMSSRVEHAVNTYPASIYIYDTTTWKPIAQWDCGRIGESSEFIFSKDGTLYQRRGNEINALDVTSLKRLTDD
jgi:hypothetical protein